MGDRSWTRRGFLRSVAMTTAGVVAAACQPKIVEVEKIVEKEVTKVVQEIVKETIIVEGTPQVVEKVVEKQVTVAPAPKERIVLQPSTFMGSAEGYMEPRSKDFEKVYPNVTVEPLIIPRAEYNTKILAFAAAGQTPDIVWGAIFGGGYINLALMGIVIPLNDIAAGEGVDFYEEWITPSIDVGSWQGKVYALPNMATAGSTALYFNKTLFEELGLPLPSLETTLEEMMVAAENVSVEERGARRFGYNVGTDYVGLNPSMRTFGAEFMDPEGKQVLMDSPEGIQCIQWVQDMMWKSKVKPTAGDMTGTNAPRLFAGGQLATFVATVSNVHDLDAMIEGAFEWDCTLIPKKEDVGVRGSCIATHHLGISKDCKHRQEAWDLLYYFTNHEAGVIKVLRGWGNPGARHDSWTDPLVQAIHPIYAPQYDLLKTAGMHILPWNCHGPELMDVITNGMQAVWANEATAEEGIEATAAAMRDVLAKAPIG